MSSIDKKESEAWRLTEEEKFDEAFKLYNECRLDQPLIGRYWFGCGINQLKLKNLVDANEYFIVAHFLDKENFPSAYNVGITFVQLGDYSASIRYFNRAIELKDNDYVPYHYKGFSLSRIGEYYEAIKFFNKARELNDNYSPTYYELGFAYFQIQDYSNAQVNLKIAKEKGFHIEKVDSLIKKINDELKKAERGYSGYGTSGYGPTGPNSYGSSGYGATGPIGPNNL